MSALHTRIAALPGARLRRLLVVCGALTLVQSAVVIWIVATADRGEAIGLDLAAVLLIGWSFAGTGLFAWWRRPANLVGPLMWLTGFFWFFSLYTLSDLIPLFVAGYLLSSVSFGFLIHLLLVFPDGVLHSRAERLVAAAGYFVVTVMQLGSALLIDPPRDGCDGCPDNPLLLTADPDPYAVFGAVQGLAGIVVLAALVVALVRRWRRWPQARRSQFAPVLWAGAISLSLLSVMLAAEVLGLPHGPRRVIFLVALIPFAAIPFAFLTGLLRSRISDAEAAAASAAGLRVENERLDAELRIQNAELRASRARIVEAGYRERRRVERDLHDGAQQRLMALALKLRLARTKLEQEPGEAGTLLDEATAELERATAELRELARGIHPGLLSERGLVPALEALASRAPVPVELTAELAERPPSGVEAATYFLVSEALANVARHAGAERASVRIARSDGSLEVEVADDGRGGADPGGSGLQGLADRVAALDGSFSVADGRRGGTVVRASMPLG